jgi:PAS domain S-box-containing protein
MDQYTSLATFLATIVANAIIFIRVLNKKLQPIKEDSEFTKHQVTRNSGSSLYDAVKRIENNVDNLRGWLRGIQQINPHPVYETDQQGYYVWVNPAYSKAVGASMQDLTSKSWLSTVHVDDQEQVKESWERAVSYQGIFNATFKMVNLVDGHSFEVKSTAYPIKTDDGNLLGYIGTLSLVNPIPGCSFFNSENIQIFKP